MKAFVTGGTGFVGSHLIEALLAQGAEVRALVRTPAKADRLFGEHRPHYVPGDLANLAALRAGAEGADVIFHAAALTAARTREEFLGVNVTATQRLLEVAGNARFVHVSTLAAAGPSPRGRPREGHEPSAPVTPYGTSKLAAEEAVRGSGLAWTIVRPPTVYGPRDVELLKMFRLVRRGIAPVFGDGSQEITLIYVEDLARALIAAAGAAPGAIYHATHPETVTTRALVEQIGLAVRGRPPLVVPLPAWLARAALAVTGTAARLAGRATLLSADKAPEFLATGWTARPDRLVAATGWTPTVALREGLERTTAWYRAHGWL